MNMMDWVGKTLGQYRIEAPLDAGGMGQVFLGKHILLDRSAAIKVMRADLADNPNFRRRFLQEAKAAALLKHPNIVEIYDFGEQGGHLYLVMEYIGDGSLRMLLRRRAGGQPWTISLGLELARQAAEGLAEADARGMVHRDIKPDNLLLNRLKRGGKPLEPEQYQLKISDFGLAQLAEGSGLTSTGAPMGTLAYMSPEQCLGAKLDGRSDLYSLGIALYQIATGYLPFQINNFEEAKHKHNSFAPLPPRQVRADVPPLVEEIILRCLAKKPEERYATGTELAQALQRALSDEGLKTVTQISLPPPKSEGETALQPLQVGGTPPPFVNTLPGTSKYPRVRVLDQHGQTLRVAEVTGYGLIVGRQSDCDIVLADQSVSRQHLRVTWDNTQVTATDLGSSNGTLIGDGRLQPRESRIWMPRQVIRLGPFWLRLEGPDQQAVSSMPEGLSQTQLRSGSMSQTQLRNALPYPTSRQRAESLAGSGRIGVLVEPDALTITPGQPAMFQVTLVNLGSIVDWFTITLEGVAQEWVQKQGNRVKLNPGMEQAVIQNVNVPRTASSHAGDYAVTIRVLSRENPGESGTAQAQWTVLPFKEEALRLEPRRASGRGKANYTVALFNAGNAFADYSLSGDDDEQKLAYRFGQNEVRLEPGKEEKIPLAVGTRRRWLGRDQRQPFQVHARPAGSSIPLTTPGEFVNKPLLPTWLLTAVGVVLAACVALGAVFHVPPFPGSGTTPTHVTTHIVGGSTNTTNSMPSPTVASSPKVSPTASIPSPTVTPPPTVTVPSGTSWTSQQSGTSNSLHGVTRSESEYIAVGDNGTIFTSRDGIHWTPQNDSATSSNLNSVTWSATPSQYVAVGDNGTIITSTDGIHWAEQRSHDTNAPYNALYSVIWSGSQYVAVGYGAILTSTDGLNWTPQSFSGEYVAVLKSVTWSAAQSQYVAVGCGSCSYTSPDGMHWTSQGDIAGGNFAEGVSWSAALSQYVVVTDAGTFITSSDGSHWTSINPQPNLGNFLDSVTWSGSQYVAVGDPPILTSSDGSHWTRQGPYTNRLYSVIWSAAQSQYVAVGAQGTILTSP
jgi:serine/threonine protein kinase/photosystem II stability/assembly factor-like uncharacterized protein